MKILLTVPPSPPHMDIYRSFAGGFGTARRVKRKTFGHSTTAFPPIDLAAAGRAFNDKGHRAEILDAQVLRLDRSKYVQEASRRNPDLVFSQVSLPSLRADLNLLQELSRKLQGIQILTVGTAPRLLPRDVLGHGFGVVFTEIESYAYLADPEGLLDTSNRGGDALAQEGVVMPDRGEDSNRGLLLDPLAEMDDSPLPDFGLLPMEGYVTKRFDGTERRFTISHGSKGCPYSCGYCPYPVGHGRKPRSKSAGRVLEEIDLATEHGVTGVFFRDQDFLLDKKRLKEICSGLRARDTDLVWECETRVDRIDEETVKMIADAGCRRVNTGVETGDRALFDAEAKPGVNFNAVPTAFQALRKVGVSSRAFLMVGLPGETWASIDRTRGLIENLDADTVQVAVLTPYPGTQLYRNLEEEGFKFPRWETFTGFDPVMPTKELSEPDLVLARDLVILVHRLKKRRSTIGKGGAIRRVPASLRYLKTLTRLKYVELRIRMRRTRR